MLIFLDLLSGIRFKFFSFMLSLVGVLLVFVFGDIQLDIIILTSLAASITPVILLVLNSNLGSIYQFQLACLVIALTPVYQLGISRVGILFAPELLCAPMLLALLLALFYNVSVSSKLDRSAVLIAGLWLAVHIPALIVTKYNEYGAFLVVAVFLPIAALGLAAKSSYHDTVNSRDVIIRIVIACHIIQMVVAIGVHLVEYNARGATSWIGIQHSNLYTITGNSLLIWPLLFGMRNSISDGSKSIFLFLFVTTVALSLSRGALVVAPFIVAFTLLGFTQRIRYRAAVIGAAFAFTAILSMQNFWTFFMARTNQSENGFDILTFLTPDTRYPVWDIAINAISENPILGYGIGGSPEIYSRASGNLWQFSSAHNIFLTTGLERGIIAAAVLFLSFITLMVIGRLRDLRGESKHQKYGWIVGIVCFLVFANSTGSELILLTSVDARMEASLYLVILLYCAFMPDNQKPPLGL